MKKEKPTPLEMPGSHGLQREPKVETSAIRLCRLLKLTTDISPVRLMREAGDEIVRLRRTGAVEPPADGPQSKTAP